MKKTIRLSAYTILFMLLLSACKKDWLDVNKDPNFPDDAPVENLFPAGVTSIAGQFGSYYNIAGSMFVQNWTQINIANQYKEWDSYNLSNSTLQEQWLEVYSGGLNDLNRVKEKSYRDKNWNYYLMATVMEAWTFQMMADMYDQIPFDQCFKGDKGLLNPVYRDGAVVYDSLITRLDFALSQDLKAITSKTPAEDDFVFGGDMDQWKRFANTVKLKIYLRQCYARPAVSEAGVKKLMDDANIEFLTSDAAVNGYIDQTYKDNPLYEVDQRSLGTQTNIAASHTFVSYLDDNNDPRLYQLFWTTASNLVVGMEHGNYGLTDGNGTYSNAYIAAEAPVYFICEAESYFLQAEAKLRFYGGAGAKAKYDAGVSASFTRVGESSSGFLGAGQPYEYSTTGTMEEQLEDIMTQKWVALAGIEGMEMWIERNRCGYPILSDQSRQFDDNGTANPKYVSGQIIIPVGAVTKEYPRRLVFVKSEKDYNTSTPSAVGAQTKTWWDKKP